MYITKSGIDDAEGTCTVHALTHDNYKIFVRAWTKHMHNHTASLQRGRGVPKELLSIFHVFERAAERQWHSCFREIFGVITLEPSIQHTARCVLVADTTTSQPTDNARRTEGDSEVVRIARGTERARRST